MEAYGAINASLRKTPQRPQALMQRKNHVVCCDRVNTTNFVQSRLILQAISGRCKTKMLAGARSVVSKLYILSTWAFRTLTYGVSHVLPLVKIIVSDSLAGGAVEEHVFPVVLCGNKSKTLVGETLDRSLFHLSLSNTSSGS